MEDGEMERWRGGWRDGEMGTWRGGEIDGEVKRWRCGELEMWKNGEMEDGEVETELWRGERVPRPPCTGCVWCLLPRLLPSTFLHASGRAFLQTFLWGEVQPALAQHVRAVWGQGLGTGSGDRVWDRV